MTQKLVQNVYRWSTPSGMLGIIFCRQNDATITANWIPALQNTPMQSILVDYFQFSFTFQGSNASIAQMSISMPIDSNNKQTSGPTYNFKNSLKFWNYSSLVFSDIFHDIFLLHQPPRFMESTSLPSAPHPHPSRHIHTASFYNFRKKYSTLNLHRQ